MIQEKIRIPPYDQVPKIRKDIEEIEKLIETRMKLLEKIDKKLNPNKLQNETIANKYNYQDLKNLIPEQEGLIGWKNNNIDDDIISHMFLCLAFCKNETQKNWYLFKIYIYQKDLKLKEFLFLLILIRFPNLEAKLFIARILHYNLNSEEVLTFLKFPYEIAQNVSSELIEKIRFKNSKKIIKNEDSNQKDNDIIYKIPFEYGLNLISTMEYFIYKGYIYVFKDDLNKLIETVIRENVIKRVNNIARNYDGITSDRRISEIIKRFFLKKECKNENLTLMS